MSLEATHYYINQAAKALQITPTLQAMLNKPYRTLKTNINIEMDNGSVNTFTGFRIQHNNILGPMKGGLRFHPSLDEYDSESLASLMTWKTALMKLPYGGAKGGIQCDPSTLSEAELERLTKSFTEQIKDIIGPNQDIPAPDINTNAQIMAWIMLEYSKHKGFEPAVVTGKPIYLHGSEGREQATGLGVAILTAKILSENNRSVQNSTFVIQGFGNVGYHAAKYIHEYGGRIIAISDASGGTYDPNGINPAELMQHLKNNNTMQNYAGTFISNDELLTLPCDTLIPAALGDVFDASTAQSVNCQFIVEAANSPTLPDADEIFNQRGIIVLPDLLANSGGVVSSYFEWVQNMQRFQWDNTKINTEFNSILSDGFLRVVAYAKEKRCTLREAAYIIGLGRVAKAKFTLGL